MALNYKNIVPWGRNYDEYKRMFDLKDLRSNILGCGDGRVSGEARIFPLLDINSNRSPYVDKILTDFKKNRIEIKKVNYEFQIGGNELLIIKKLNIRKRLPFK